MDAGETSLTTAPSENLSDAEDVSNTNTPAPTAAENLSEQNTVLPTIEEEAGLEPVSVVEELIKNGKLITVSSPAGSVEGDFLDVPVRIEIAEIFRVGQEDKIKINWTNNENQEMEFSASDEDGNGYIDHLAWIVPHLSTQTFEVILISDALLSGS